MTVYPIPKSLADKYQGSGHALAAVTGGQIVGLVYLRNALPDYDEGEGIARQAVALNDDRLGPTVRALQALGDVTVGMCSCWEFVVL